MRQRMADAHPNKTELFDLKHDRGGLIDVEFIVQYLVLGYAHQHASLTGNLGNIALLGMAGELGLIPADQGRRGRRQLPRIPPPAARPAPQQPGLPRAPRAGRRRWRRGAEAVERGLRGQPRGISRRPRHPFQPAGALPAPRLRRNPAGLERVPATKAPTAIQKVNTSRPKPVQSAHRAPANQRTGIPFICFARSP